ncbi:unnamed protein product [Prorocentrum cordatum]|uniref:Carboxylesterase type B domain-containing protein n=1 Tax=Prorocentrum cordatum TaxID=2364126 RepID=A0ABN9PRH7_9DINO|nr:unnamed protein product [Polarella glacialis]
MADEALEEAGGAELAGAPCAELPGLGRIRGSARGGVARFLGVPYAAAQRWRPPGPPEPWAGVREDPAELPRCPQPSRTGKTFRGHDLVDSEERCLVLNIWAPQSALPLSAASGAEAGLRPVLVYIPGGGGKVHSAHGPAESGLALARAHGLCCFHLNYRPSRVADKSRREVFLCSASGGPCWASGPSIADSG